jgi:hypothetical protein
MVWKTEVLAAQRGGAHIEGIALLEEDSLRTEVSYVIGTLKTSKHLEASVAFLSFLRLPECQNAYPNLGLSRRAIVNCSSSQFLELRARRGDRLLQCASPVIE